MKFIKINKVSELTTFSRATIYRLIKNGQFPAPVKLAQRSSGWIEQDVIDYLNIKIQESKEKVCGTE